MPIYDLAIIGAGWAGFTAALKAKELGLKTCLIESGPIGGTCLNHGCIPTKTLIQSAKIFSLAKKSSSFGVETDNPRINFAKIQERKNKIVWELGLGMQSRLLNIDLIKSTAQVVSIGQIKTDEGLIKSKSILIATGSCAGQLPGLEFNGEKIISSEQAFALTEVPDSLLVIGGGVIGCEFASLFSILGSRVTIAEKMPFLLPGEDRDVSRKIEVIFNKKGIKVVTAADIASFNLGDYSKVLVCVGRLANTAGLGLENLGVKLEKSRIIVNDYLRSSVNNIYAAGDCCSNTMLAHYAAYQGRIAVGNLASNKKVKANNKIIPACIFTQPQIASVGANEESATGAGLAIKVHKFDFRASGMAHIIDETEGFIKVISNQKTQKIIGASIVGPQASELIAIFTVAISAQLKISQIRQIIFAHPTLSESICEVV